MKSDHERPDASVARDSAARSSALYRLRELSDLDIVEGEPDPRGWDVFSASGTKVGKVSALIIDPQALKVRYLDVELDRESLDIQEERHVLVPIGYATLAGDIDRVRIESITAADFRALPAYDERPVTRHYEEVLRAHFEDLAESAERVRRARAEDFFYSDRSYDDAHFLSERGKPNDYLVDRSRRQ